MFSVSFIMNVSTHLMRDLIPHQVGGDALIRWSPSCGGWGPNSLQVLTKTPFIIVYQAYDYFDMIISCKALQWGGPFPVLVGKNRAYNRGGCWLVFTSQEIGHLLSPHSGGPGTPLIRLRWCHFLTPYGWSAG